MLQTTALWMEREAQEVTDLQPEAALEGVVTRGENQKLFLSLKLNKSNILFTFLTSVICF
jgi:hypothetical protein